MMSYRSVTTEFNEKYAPYIRSVRDGVFVTEQGIDTSIEHDGLDHDALHVLVFVNNQAAATGRILADGHIGRVAVISAFRGQGLGGEVMRTLLNATKQKNYPRAYLNAQSSAIEFYKKLGFHEYGDSFVEAGIDHQAMEYRIDA
ncbi:MAG: GNAT family N-acetyltransferase [Vibrio sp.]